MNTIRFAVCVATAFAIFSAPSMASNDASHHCSIHPPKGAEASALQAMAKVTREDALQAATDSLKTSSPVTAVETELEAEDGCLVWSFDLKVTGAKGIEEVQIDAGNGRVVSHEHESAKKEKKEKAAEGK